MENTITINIKELADLAQQIADATVALSSIAMKIDALVKAEAEKAVEAPKAEPKKRGRKKKEAEPQETAKAEEAPKAEAEPQETAKKHSIDKYPFAHIGKYLITKTKHSKTDEDLWVLTLAERKDKQDFTTLSIALAQKFNAHYSRYCQGFIFREDKSKELRQAIINEKRAEKQNA